MLDMPAPGPTLPRRPRPLTRAWRGFRKRVRARRRWLAAGFTMVAVAFGMNAMSPSALPMVSLLVAAHDLPAGTTIDSSDLSEVSVPPVAAAKGALADPVGRQLLSPVRAGEAITDARVARDAGVQGYPGLVTVPVRLSDSEVARLLEVGDRVDLLSVDPGTGVTERVALGALVVGLPRLEPGAGSTGVVGAVVVVALDTGEVSDTMEASVRKFLTIQWSS